MGDVFDLLWHKGHELMKQGGGPLPGTHRTPVKHDLKKLRPRLKAWIKEGLTQDQIGVRLDLHQAQVSKLLQRAKLKTKPRNNSLRVHQKKFLTLCAIRPRLHQEEIGRRLGGISPQLISRWMIRLGLRRVQR